MYSVWDVLWLSHVILSPLSIGMFPVGELSLGPGPWDVAPVAADTPVPEMSPSDMLMLIHADKGLQINLLALLSAVLIGFRVLVGSRRRRSGNTIIVNLLRVAHTTSLPLFGYTIGLIQAVEAPKQLDSQLLWAVGLLLLLGSVDGMSAFSRQEVEDSKGIQAEHIMQTVLVLWLLVSRSDVSEGGWILLLYFLLCWVYSILRVAQRMKALRKASSVHGLVRSAKVVADYMQHLYAASAGDRDRDGNHNPMDMAKCKYLVLGEEKDSSPPSKAPYYLSEVGGKGKLVTFDMIFNSKDKLLLSPSPDDDQKRKRLPLEDICLSFALFKLLKRRFCPGLPIAEEGDPKALEFILAEGKDAFRLVEVELSFLYDLFYTKYPVLFPAAPALRVVRFVVLVVLFKVLLLDFALEATSYITDNVPADMLENDTGYSSKKAVVFILFNNILVVFMILSIDILQGVATGYSNWAIVHYVCDYVYERRRRPTDGSCSNGWWMTAKRWWNRGFGIRRALIKWVAARRANKPAQWWDNKLGQYSLLNSCGYTAHTTNALSLLTLRLLEKTGEGRKRDKDAILTDEIKEEVLCSLKKSNDRLSVDLSGNKLLRLHRTPFDLSRSTHMVLVWHIATTICADQEKQVQGATTICSDQEQQDQGATTICTGHEQQDKGATTVCVDQEQEEQGATTICADQEQQDQGATTICVDQEQEEQGATTIYAHQEQQDQGATTICVDQEQEEQGATTIYAHQEQQDQGATTICVDQEQEDQGATTIRADQEQQDQGATTIRADQEQQDHGATTIRADQEQQDQGTDNSDQLCSSRRVATTLSSYCAYLLAFVPDMLPDHSYTATQILDAVILDARDRLGTTKTLSERCKKMLQLGKQPDSSSIAVQDMSILILGASLADKLLSEKEGPPWKLLAGFWADLVLYLAPSDKTDVHADQLATGGEFMTHLWALLTHAGILDRPDIHAASHA